MIVQNLGLGMWNEQKHKIVCKERGDDWGLNIINWSGRTWVIGLGVRFYFKLWVKPLSNLNAKNQLTDPLAQ